MPAAVELPCRMIFPACEPVPREPALRRHARRANPARPSILCSGPLLRLHLVTPRRGSPRAALHRAPHGLRRLVVRHDHGRTGGGLQRAPRRTLAMLPPAMSFADYARLEVQAKRTAPARVAAEGYWIEQFTRRGSRARTADRPSAPAGENLSPARWRRGSWTRTASPG